jgi:hypothetical protein
MIMLVLHKDALFHSAAFFINCVEDFLNANRYCFAKYFVIYGLYLIKAIKI